MPRKQLLHFFIIMVAVSSIVTALADVCYLIYGKNSISVTFPAAFPNLELRDGILHPHDGSPYIPPAYTVDPIFAQIFKMSAKSGNDANVRIAIDTASNPVITIKYPMILLTARKVVIYLNEKTTMELSYEQILPGTENFQFTSDQIALYLKKFAVGIFLGYFLSAVVNNLILFLFSIFFLAFAAFIFRMERQRKLKEYVKIAIHAISPVFLGCMIVAISGVRFDWIWHVLIFLSVIVMLRAIMAISIVDKRLRE